MREIACDESGYEGEKLIGSTTALFAHASVSLSDPAGALAELRDRIRSPATQYKATHLLREKHRPFLGPDGPVHGRGHVVLLDKRELVRSAYAQVTGHPPPDAELARANDLLRIRCAIAPSGPDRESLERFRGWLLADPIARSILDPLVPAIAAAVRHWGPVTVAHDRQTQLPPRRIAVLRARCRGDLHEIRFLDAESHPEIQIADILAGTVRRIAEGDVPALRGLLAPYLSA